MRKLSNNNLIYIVAFLVIVVAFLLLGGRQWTNSMMHSNSSMNMGSINWIQILIGIVIGFVLGILYKSRRWF